MNEDDIRRIVREEIAKAVADGTIEMAMFGGKISKPSATIGSGVAWIGSVQSGADWSDSPAIVNG